jgi:hypothetical protein
MKKEVIAVCQSFGSAWYGVKKVMERLKDVDAKDQPNLQNRKSVMLVLRALEAEGAITRVRESIVVSPETGYPLKEIVYSNTKRLELRERRSPETGWDKMWLVARAMRRFTSLDLITVCGQNASSVSSFTSYYRKLGFFRNEKSPSKFKIWTLIKDLGPKRPKCRRQGHVD